MISSSIESPITLSIFCFTKQRRYETLDKGHYEILDWASFHYDFLYVSGPSLGMKGVERLTEEPFFAWLIRLKSFHLLNEGTTSLLC